MSREFNTATWRHLKPAWRQRAGGRLHWRWFASQRCSWVACKPPPNSWPGVLFTATAGGVLALSWLSIKVRWHGVETTIWDLFQQKQNYCLWFYTLHVGYTCQLRLPHVCGVCSKLEVLMIFEERPAISINDSLSFLFCLQHFLSSCDCNWHAREVSMVQ